MHVQTPEIIVGERQPFRCPSRCLASDADIALAHATETKNRSTAHKYTTPTEYDAGEKVCSAALSSEPSTLTFWAGGCGLLVRQTAATFSILPISSSGCYDWSWIILSISIAWFGVLTLCVRLNSSVLFGFALAWGYWYLHTLPSSSESIQFVISLVN